MIKAATGTQMREIDRIAIQEMGIDGLDLMEAAGQCLAEEIELEVQQSRSKKIIIVCGGGNNGGDGYVAARLLQGKNIFPQVFSVINPEDLSGDARINYEIYVEKGGTVKQIKSCNDFVCLSESLSLADVIVDAIFGTGMNREITGLIKEVIRIINAAGKTVIAVDIPSGVNGDDGKVYGCSIRADKTVTFQRMKVGMLIDPGKTLAGKIRVVDIGLPEELCDQQAGEYQQMDLEEARKHLPKRPREMNKSNAGKVLLVAGSKGMAGAAVLAATAALRSGSGLVKVAAPWEVIQVLQCTIPEATGLILGEPGHNTIDLIMTEARNYDAVAIGPGIGRSEENRQLVEHMIKGLDRPLLIDADGINVIAGNPQVLKEARTPIILTPHPGEMGRLIGKSAKEVNQERITIAKTFSSEYNVTLVLKGADSVIAVPKGRVYINGTGNPGMATGGSGDVLSGIIAALFASGKSAATAATLGAYIHGLAGDIQMKSLGEYGMLASDIATATALAICLITGEHKEGEPVKIGGN